MADESQLSLLKQGVKAWNEWRREHQRARADLSEADLHEADLTEADLHCAILNEANLHGANLSKADLREANLNGADLSEANLYGADLNKADVREANLREANLRGANVSRTDLSGADLRGAKLQGAKLGGAILSRANLRGTDLSGASIFEADLRKTNLSEANLSEGKAIGADLSGTDLTGAALSRANLFEVNLHGANLSDASLFEADLRKADLKKADLRKANLSNASLNEANLSGANLSRTNLSGADLSEAKLSEVSLSGAVMLRAILRSAVLDYANFEKAIVGHTIFGNIDMSSCTGLGSVRHGGPSTLGVDSIIRSKGQIPEIFLRGVGLPDEWIDYIPSLVWEGIQFFSCFISYSGADKPFADRLYAALQAKGVRCWLDEKQLLPGDDISRELERGIHSWDKFLLCASKNSLTSYWVENEIKTTLGKELALRKEKGKAVHKLIPLNLDGYMFSSEWDLGILANEIRSRVAADFRDWENSSSNFDKQVDRVIKALRADEGAREKPPPSRI